MLCVNTELFDLDFYEYFVCRKAKLSVCMKGVEGVAGVEMLFFVKILAFSREIFQNPAESFQSED